MKKTLAPIALLLAISTINPALAISPKPSTLTIDNTQNNDNITICERNHKPITIESNSTAQASLLTRHGNLYVYEGLSCKRNKKYCTAQHDCIAILGTKLKKTVTLKKIIIHMFQVQINGNNLQFRSL